MGAATLTSVVWIAVAAALAPLLAQALARRVVVSAVVIEIVLGIILGPDVTGLATATDVVTALADFGLVMLFFLAGYEIDFERIRGTRLGRALVSWVVSLAVGFGIGMLLTLLVGGGIDGAFVIGLAMATTALGAILPILRDAGLLDQPFGAATMAVGAIGEFVPLLVVAIVLGKQAPGESAIVLAVFALVAILAGVLALRPNPRRINKAISGTLATSGQFAVRLIMVVVLALVWLAVALDLDVILGAFAAGVTIRLLLSEVPEHEAATIDSKLDSVAFGVFIPVFFIVTGITFDLRALVHSRVALVLVPIALVSFLLVRGLPVGFAFRGLLPRREVAALQLFAATELPLVVVITGFGVDYGWLTSAAAAGLVGAAMLSVLIYPVLALRLARDASVPADS